jgi:hypothetical protein
MSESATFKIELIDKNPPAGPAKPAPPAAARPAPVAIQAAPTPRRMVSAAPLPAAPSGKPGASRTSQLVGAPAVEPLLKQFPWLRQQVRPTAGVPRGDTTQIISAQGAGTPPAAGIRPPAPKSLPPTQIIGASKSGSPTQPLGAPKAGPMASAASIHLSAVQVNIKAATVNVAGSGGASAAAATPPPAQAKPKKAQGRDPFERAYFMTQVIGAASAGARPIGAALGGSEQGLGAAAAQAGLQLAQAVAPMFGPVGAVVGAAAHGVSTALELVEEASRQAAKNIREFGTISARFHAGDILGAQQRLLQKQQEEEGTRLKYTLISAPLAFLADYFKGRNLTPGQSAGAQAAAIGALQEHKQVIQATAQALGPFSAEISAATAQIQATRIQAQANLASQYGGNYARFVTNQGSLQLAQETVATRRQQDLINKIAGLTDQQILSNAKLVEEMRQLNDPEHLRRLLSDQTEEGKKFQAEVLREMARIRRGLDHPQLTLPDMLEQFRRNLRFLDPAPPKDEMMDNPDWARDAMIRPLGV